MVTPRGGSGKPEVSSRWMSDPGQAQVHGGIRELAAAMTCPIRVILHASPAPVGSGSGIPLEFSGLCSQLTNGAGEAPAGMDNPGVGRMPEGQVR